MTRTLAIFVLIFTSARILEEARVQIRIAELKTRSLAETREARENKNKKKAKDAKEAKETKVKKPEGFYRVRLSQKAYL